MFLGIRQTHESMFVFTNKTHRTLFSLEHEIYSEFAYRLLCNVIILLHIFQPCYILYIIYTIYDCFTCVAYFPAQNGNKRTAGRMFLCFRSFALNVICRYKSILSNKAN